VDAVLHRIEALPGGGRYAVTWTFGDGSEQTAVVQLRDTDTDTHVEVADASLPPGWTSTSAAFEAAVRAVRAVETARRLASASQLRDVDGGWDVSLGNVVLGPDGVPTCTAHGPMQPIEGVQPTGERRFTCPECGAAAVLG
jgi:hypothetical protein